MSDILPFSEKKTKHKTKRILYFNRFELEKLLALYSSRVSKGEWRDYAIDHCPGLAVFSIFRHSHENALLAISKTQISGKQAPLYEIHMGPQKLYRGTNLEDLLRKIDKKLHLVR